ncbi:MAG: cytochrome c3 family protein [Nitrospinota bacterium]
MLGFFLVTLLAAVLIPFAVLRRRRGRGEVARGTLKVVVALTFLGIAWGSAQAVIPNEACLGCHRNPIFTTLKDGSKVSLQISGDDFAKSVHGNRLLCTGCHRNITKLPHPPESFANRRALTLNYSQACTICHSRKFREFQESIHLQILSRGDSRAPLCADCHGAHKVTEGGLGRGQVSLTCANCHSEIFEAFRWSVHGNALVGAGNPDVPTCTTCHRSHAIQDPRKVAFRIDIPKLCADCHRNKTLMDKYGLSTEVISTYLQDFHGVSVGLYRRQENAPVRLTAVCTDCHGIHDIRSSWESQAGVGEANLLRTCQKCHPGAPPNFPDAWLSHYIPSPKRAPLVYYVKLFYLFFLPGVVICVGVHVGLDLIHEVKARRAMRERKI